MNEARNAEPMPKAMVSSVRAFGRSISGRIGMSLASTVSSVMEVPVTQSCLYPSFSPAWTEAISSSAAA